MPRRKTNKAQAIRDTLQTIGPDAKPKEVIAHLAEKKITVSAAQVSNVKASLRGKSGSKNGLTVDSLIEAKKLADKMGGIDRAKKALDTLAELR